MTPSKNPQSYRGLPTLAGLATIAEAARPGLGVEACVARLKRYHYAFVRLHEIFTARITAEPIYELKTGVLAPRLPLRRARRGAPRRASARCASRRSGWRPCPDPALEIFFDEILAAPDDRASCSSASTRWPCPALDAGPRPAHRPTRTRWPTPPRSASAGSPGSSWPT